MAATNLSMRSLLHASSNSAQPGKPRVLEKPTKFNPPSHGSRLPRNKPRYTYGPKLTEEQKSQQKTKKYPNMMPPEGTLMHWILTNKALHLYISMSVLFSLAFFVFLQNFLHETPYVDLLPPASDFWAHPFRFIGQYAEVYKMHTAYVSEKTAEMRRRKVEDVDKRAAYRKAHGLDKKETGLFADFVGSREGTDTVEAGPTAVAQGSPSQGSDSEVYTDFQGRKKPIKKWLGIW
ncbi:hypothetical protein K490DRAFT_75882 [Saccharata proteae CBS 121410]|uniref:Uncharacterized protein n=1 Tax=Saccharata proteae CBS 121410 TaxID=1314787 RepID=A0A9P4HRA7_9PEZI|nr:hypothetical protein K490DRAFT_75882 [Saccharata proteae CBS 121410]